MNLRRLDGPIRPVAATQNAVGERSRLVRQLFAVLELKTTRLHGTRCDPDQQVLEGLPMVRLRRFQSLKYNLKLEGFVSDDLVEVLRKCSPVRG